MPDPGNKSINTPVVMYKDHRLTPAEEVVVREVPVTLFLNEREFVTLVCSPGELRELAVGFLCSEGVLRKREDLREVTINEGEGLIWVEAAVEAPSEETFLKRFITTCCGRGRASFYFINDARGISPLTSDLRVAPRTVLSLVNQLEERSSLFRLTGGVHSAALCTGGEALAFYEDIGRHNAVDKIFGRCFLEGIPLRDKIIVISGRVSSEILIKTTRMGVPMVVSRSAPTKLAVDLAEEMGITVVGFARGDRFNIYSRSERIVPDSD